MPVYRVVERVTRDILVAAPDAESAKDMGWNSHDGREFEWDVIAVELQEDLDPDDYPNSDDEENW